MYGVFKKLNANDIKITPFEANKQYVISDFSSTGVITSSAYWSSNNKANFTSESIKYFQLDKLYYRDYIHTRANRLEINDAPYKSQERRLYDSASIISIPQSHFGNEIQPNTLVISSSYIIYDDGLGNLYDSNIGKDNFPNEDHRVLYMGLVKGFKLKDLSIDPITGNNKVNYTSSFYGKLYDDSYFSNIVEYYNIEVDRNLYNNFYHFKSKNTGLIQIENRPYLNFNNSDFTINFNLRVDPAILGFLLLPPSTTLLVSDLYLISKEGAYLNNSLPLENNIQNSTLSLIEGNGKFPYRIYIKQRHPTNSTSSLCLERSDGNNTVIVSSSLYVGAVGSGFPFNKHIVCQKSGSNLNIYIDGVLTSTAIDNTIDCGNSNPITLFGKINNNGTISNRPQIATGVYHTAPISQLMMWDKALSSNEIIKVSESFTGTYPIGNIFYDNGFISITHPSYQDILGDLHSISYRNTYPITEWEYQCTVNEQEFNYTSNLTARKSYDEFANFTTGSNFKPYITTIGLYDDDANLLAVAKLGQPIKISSETDTTFILRYDL